MGRPPDTVSLGCPCLVWITTDPQGCPCHNMATVSQEHVLPIHHGGPRVRLPPHGCDLFFVKNVWKGVLCAFEKFWSIRAKAFEAQWPGPTARLERAMTGLGRLMAASRAAARQFCRHHGATASTSLPPPPLWLLTGKRVQACCHRTLFPAGCEREEQHPALAWPSVSAFPKVPRKG